MLYKDLLQAKKEGRWVATPDGVGQLNGIGLASSPVLSPVEGYVAFPDPHPDILFRLLLFGNEDIQEVDAEPYLTKSAFVDRITGTSIEIYVFLSDLGNHGTTQTHSKRDHPIPTTRRHPAHRFGPAQGYPTDGGLRLRPAGRL